MSKHARFTHVQTPGAAPAAESPAEQGGEPQADAGEQVTLTKGELDAIVKDAVAQALAAQPRVVVPTAPAKVAEKLPAYDEVVAAKPAKPVLTDQGWYIPPGYGAIPGAPKV